MVCMEAGQQKRQQRRPRRLERASLQSPDRVQAAGRRGPLETEGLRAWGPSCRRTSSS